MPIIVSIGASLKDILRNVYGSSWETRNNERTGAVEINVYKARGTLGTGSLSSWESLLEMTRCRAGYRSLNMYHLFTNETLQKFLLGILNMLKYFMVALLFSENFNSGSNNCNAERKPLLQI